ncbi:MAG: DNA polymerase III subunit alpha [Clostridia bacterium]|nr:DNA polymerase III subunit alpha [Clostridia bacterium]
MSSSRFVHLHLHTEYSLLDGVCRLEQAIAHAKNLGQSAIAITDHGNMYGAFEFYKLAKKHGIKPIIGCEVYVAPRGMEDKQHGIDSENNHLILLCKDNTGYQNLIKLVSEAWTKGFYSRPRIDRALLEKHHEGLIALSACLAGEVPRAITSNDYEKAKKIALWYDSVMGRGNYYLELQDHGMREQKVVNSALIRLSKETGIPLVATNDAHYITKEDSRVQKILICIQTKKTIDEDTGIGFDTDQSYIKSEQEMLDLFPNHPEAIYNTAEIAERCNVEFETGNIILPHFELPDGCDHFEYFKKLCLDGLYKRYSNPTKEHFDRLNYELEVINKMGYVDYFLIVQDFVRFAKHNGISVGPGRGSGAGCLCAYCVEITDIDPIKYNLLFERFLNSERVSMPDFDIDFCYERRNEVIEYVNRKYGADHVAQIVTFGTMAAKAAVRDVGRVMGIPYNVVDSVAKLIPTELHITLENALKNSAQLRKLYDEDERTKLLIDLAKKVEGMPRHASIHAAGVVITRDEVTKYVPVAKNDDTITTQFTMTALEELGLLKMDFLGLRTLTVISDTEKSIREYKPDFDINKIPLDDQKVFKMMTEGHTDGIFQYESAGMRRVLSSLKPTSIEELIAIISLYRPGPMDSIDTYIFNKSNPDKIKYKTEKLERILNVTYGCIVYQEQVMEICRELAGYSYGRADIVRRAMSKKKHDVMDKERQNFIYGLKRDDGSIECEGAVARGVDEAVANEIFDEMSSFASYAFNKSHAAAYAVLAYRTAYLKRHYPAEFLASLLTSFLDNTNKVVGYCSECQRLGIKILPPSVNHSSLNFSTENKNIRYGLLAVKNLGEGLISKIISEREVGGEYTSFFNFCKRLYGRELNRRAVEALIKCGALDGLGSNRKQMITSTEQILDSLDDVRRSNIDGQIGLFDIPSDDIKSAEFVMPEMDEFSQAELLNMEKEVSGMYLSGHPMMEYNEAIAALNCNFSSSIVNGAEEGNVKDSSKVNLLGIVTKLSYKPTRNGSKLTFLTLEDQHGDIDIIIFPKTLEQNPAHLSEGNILFIKGSVQIRDVESARIVCNSFVKINSVAQAMGLVEKPKAEPQKKSKREGIFLRFDCANDDRIDAVKNLLEIFDGSFPVYFYYNDTKQYVRLPQSSFVDYNEPMIRELKRILGDENVVVSK